MARVFVINTIARCLVRGFQHAKDQYVQITEEELDSLEAAANNNIDLKEFIPLASVDPVYFENTHYLGADKDLPKISSIFPQHRSARFSASL